MTGVVGVMGRDVEVTAGALALPGHLLMPERPRGLVLFAHGSGSSRRSPRNWFVAERLFAAGLGSVLFDLLTEFEGASRANVFDIPLLSDRLVAAVRWARDEPQTGGLNVGLFGASTGGAAALVAAARAPDLIQAVVSRGGRPDLAGEALRLVQAPTLLLVGGEDHTVLDLNRDAFGRLGCVKRLAVIPGATHLFEERGALEEVARAAAAWFSEHLAARDTPLTGS